MGILSIVLVTHNSGTYIEVCLDSIFAQDFKAYEVIVIDNASEDITKAILKKKYPDIILKENMQNYGYSKALNQGIAMAEGSYILCLNDDIKLDSGFLVNIHDAIETENDIAAVQPKVIKPDGRIDTTGIYLSALRRFYDIGKGEIDGCKLTKQRYVFGACAAAVLYRKEALDSVRHSKGEYFDEDFFCIAEDVDISWRMQKKGWHILYCPEAVCVHTGGVSRSHNDISQYFSMRNRFLMIIKNESLWGFLRLPLVFLVYDLWRNLYMLLVNPEYFFKSFYEILKLSPKMLKKRWMRSPSSMDTGEELAP